MKHSEYNCFGCCKTNEKGLQLDFFRKDDRVYACWEPDADLQGYFNLLHGGIQATLLDEMGAWWVYLIGGTAGLTARLEVRYLKSVSVISGKIFLRVWMLEKRRNIYSLQAELFNNDAVLCARATLDYFSFPVDKAKAEMHFPGTESFLGTMVESADYGFPDTLFA